VQTSGRQGYSRKICAIPSVRSSSVWHGPKIRPPLVTFSDEVSEASNAEGTEFGDERILECVQASPRDIEPGELVTQVMAASRLHRGRTAGRRHHRAGRTLSRRGSDL